MAYGTINDQGSHQARENGHSEHQPLLSKAKRRHPVTRLRRYLNDDIDKKWADLILLLSYVITGLLDSSAVFIWGSFVSMQTGNTVYVGLGVVAPSEGTRWIRSGTSITFFCLGSFFISRFHRHFGAKRRWVLLASFSFQLLLIAAAAVIVMVDNGEGGDIRWEVLIPLALVAFQSSGQAVTSRALQYNALTSVVLTSIYCDLWSDPLILAGLTQNAERNRRAAAPILLVIGAILGGFWAHSSTGLAGALWTAAGLKFVVILSWVFWKGIPTSADEDEDED